MNINAKGQVVIPKEIREKFGIKPGHEIEFREENGKLVVIKKGIKDKIKKAIKKINFAFPENIKSTDKYIETIRGK